MIRHSYSSVQFITLVALIISQLLFGKIWTASAGSRYAQLLEISFPRSTLKSHMREVLHLSEDSELSTMFNTENLDPAYVFVLPGKRNKTVVFHRNDFTEMEYPNVTKVGKVDDFGRPVVNDTVLKQKSHNKTIPIAERLTVRVDDYDDYDEDDDEINKIVEENVRTEKNFIQFMEDLNEEEYDKEKTKKKQEKEKGQRKFQHYGEQFHPSLFHSPEELFPIEEVERPPPENDLRTFQRHQLPTKKFKKVHKQDYENIGEVINPPYHTDESNERFEERFRQKSGKIKRPYQSISKAEDDNYTPPNNVFNNKKDVGGWGELGLDGWSGGLSEPVVEFEDKVEKPPTSEMFHKNGMNFDNVREELQRELRPSSDYHSPKTVSFKKKNLKSSSKRKPNPSFIKNHHEEEEDLETEYVPPKLRPDHFEQHTEDDYIDDEEDDNNFEEDDDKYSQREDANQEYVYLINGKPISIELAKILERDDVPLNLTRQVRTTKQKWPITSSRSSHRDADVFVGRANNPFGHSTKWKWSNASEPEDILKHSKGKKRKGRSKRGVVQLYSMVKCATGCDPIIFKGYGCYCGFLGQGVPLDGIDRCCKMHDLCYLKSSCPSYLEYFVPYLWKCWKGQPLCAVDHGEWGGPDSCASRLCNCDQKLSMCLRRYYCPRKRNVCTSSPWRLLQNFIMDF